MAEFQWWLLIVGIVAGGGLVAIVFLDGSRRDWDVAEDERRAEAGWISRLLEGEGRNVSGDEVDAVLRAHRDYLALPPPDRLEPSADADPDRQADEVRDDGRGGADEHLAASGEQQAPTGQ